MKQKLYAIKTNKFGNFKIKCDVPPFFIFMITEVAIDLNTGEIVKTKNELLKGEVFNKGDIEKLKKEMMFITPEKENEIRRYIKIKTGGTEKVNRTKYQYIFQKS